MTLKLLDGRKIESPTEEQLRQILSAFQAGPDRDAFAILQRDTMTYLQVGGDPSIGFDMEYQEGSVDRHFRADRTDFSLDEVVRAMTAYRDGTIDWDDFGSFSRISW